MSIKSGLFAAVTTVVLMLVLGNDWVAERATDGASFGRQTRVGLVGQMRFQFWDMPSELRGATVVRLVLLVVLAAALGALAGRARPLAAFIGGWSAFLTASTLSAGAYGLVVDDRFVGRPGADTLDAFTATASFGTAAGIWLGWIVGLAVLLGRSDPAARHTPTPPPGPWGQPAGPPPTSYDPHAEARPGGYGAPPSAPAPDDAPPPPPPPPSGAPVIGTPPDRTQVFGEPPARDS